MGLYLDRLTQAIYIIMLKYDPEPLSDSFIAKEIEVYNLETISEYEFKKWAEEVLKQKRMEMNAKYN